MLCDKTESVSYDMLCHVYNDDSKPKNRCRVTLKHFYDRLGMDLREWEHWEAFVRGFHPRLFRLAGIRREELVADSGRLTTFFDRLMKVREERVTSGFTQGQADLTESRVKVRKWQEAQEEKSAQFEGRIRPIREHNNAKLRQFFPELLTLRRYRPV
jgi:hypothetical protein